MDFTDGKTYLIPHEDFKNNKLSVFVPFSMGSPKLLLNESLVSGKKNSHSVVDDQGKDCTVLFKFSVFDSVPHVVIGTNKISIAPKLKWYEYGLMMLPFTLVAIGGALGGGLGFVGMRFNNLVVRSDMSWLWKLFGCFVVTLLTIFVYFALAIPLAFWLR